MENKYDNTPEQQIELHQRYYLSPANYWFVYRTDKFDKEIIRATLYKSEPNNVVPVDDMRVGRLTEKSHHQVINYFESRITLKQFIRRQIRTA